MSPTDYKMSDVNPSSETTALKGAESTGGRNVTTLNNTLSLTEALALLAARSTAAQALVDAADTWGPNEYLFSTTASEAGR